MEPPLVSVRCMVYNQVNYIKDCIESILSQNTNFRYEIVIHDDCSTDGTLDILNEYKSKYSNIIKLYTEDENKLKSHKGYIGNLLRTVCSGKYYAMCDGDDYWTDNNKLQKQVDFLSNNPEYTMCFHNAIAHSEKGFYKDCLFSNIVDKDYSGIEIYDNWIVPSSSVMIREDVFKSKAYDSILYNEKLIFGDTPLYIVCSNVGKVRGMSDVMSVYRRDCNGMTSISDLDRQKKLLAHNLEIMNIFGREYTSQIQQSIKNICTIINK